MNLGKTIGVLIECPACGGENTIDWTSLGDQYFACQYSNCDSEFIVPDAGQVLIDVKAQQKKEV